MARRKKTPRQGVSEWAKTWGESKKIWRSLEENVAEDRDAGY